MNYEIDGQNFGVMMQVTWQSFRRNHPESETIQYWFNNLSRFEFNQVSHAFDEWIKSQDELPTLKQIIKLCQHKVSIYARLPSPLAIEANQGYAKEVIEFVAKQPKVTRDYKQWARKIMADPKNHIDIAVRYAQEALA